MGVTDLGTVIATRDLVVTDTDGDRPVTVLIGMPRPFDDTADYYCPFRIDGLGDGGVRHAAGVDAVQALLLAMPIIGAFLSASAEAREGRLRWVSDSGDLGFPDAELIGAVGRR